MMSIHSCNHLRGIVLFLCLRNASWLRFRVLNTPDKEFDMIFRPIYLLLFVFLLNSAVFAAPDDLNLGNRYFRDEVYKTAAEHYRKFLQENPRKEDEPDARLGLARSLAKMQDYENAARIYQDFLVSHANHENAAEASFELGQMMVQLGNPGKAAELFSQYSRLRHGKQAQHALFLAAREAEKANDYESAKTYGRQYLERFGKGKDLAGVYLILGKVSGRENDFREAADLLQRALQSNPQDFVKKNALWYLARAQVQLEKPQDARKSYQQVLTLADGKDSSRIVKEYSGFLQNQQDWPELVKFLQLRPLNSLAPEYQLMLTRSFVETKQYPQALQTLDKISLTDEQQIVEAAYLQARALIGNGERAEGIQVYLDQGRKGDPRAFILAAEAYARDNMFQQAIQSYYNAMEYIRSDEERIPLILKIAGIYEKDLKRYSVARSVYDDFSKNYPSSARAVEAAMGKARCLQAEGRLDESARAYLRIQEDFPAHPLASEAARQHDYITSFLLQDENAAMEHMLLVMEAGDFPTRLLQIARIFEEDLKDYQKAWDRYQKFIAQSQDTASVALAHYKSGRIQEMLAKKARYNQNPQAQSKALELARNQYTTLQQKYAASEWDDDATWRLLELAPFDLAAYTKFLSAYPQSNVLPDVLLRIGDSYLQQARTLGSQFGIKAAEYYQNILNNFADSPLRPEALLGVSEAYYYSKEYAKARPTLKFLMQNPNADRNLQAAAWTLTGQIDEVEGQYESAQRNFKEVLFRYQATSSAPKALFQLAQVYAKDNKPNDASNYYRRYIEQYPDGENIFAAHVGLSTLYENKLEWAKAIAPIKEFLDSHPDHPQRASAWERIAMLYVRRTEQESAVNAYRNAILEGKGLKDYLYRQAGELFLQLDRFDSAEVYFSKAYKIADNYKDSALAFGGLLPAKVMRGKSQEFMKMYKTFKKRFDDERELEARIIFYEGRYLMDSKQESRARRRFDFLSDRFEETSWAGEGTYYQGSISYKRGNFKSALKHFRDYIENNPQGRSLDLAYFKAASCYYQQKDYQLAVNLYHKSLAMEKTPPLIRYRAAYNAALGHEKLFQWEKAASLYQRILETWPEYAEPGVRVSAGFCWFNAQQMERARQNFEAAIADTANDRRAEGHYWYGKTLDRMGQVEEAVAEFLKVNYLYPNDPMWGLTALFEVGQIYERSQQLDKARRMYQKIVTQDGLHGSLGSRAAKYLEQMDAGLTGPGAANVGVQ